MPKLIRMPRFGKELIADGEEPRLAGWLVPDENCPLLNYRVVRRSFQDVGLEEDPEGSNRGLRLDAMTRWAGLEPPVWWCGIAVGVWFTDAGALVPEGFPATKNWLPFLSPEQYVPVPGDAILYGLKNGLPWDARLQWTPHHIGVVARVMLGEARLSDPRTIEGNRAWGGSASNNGQCVDYGPQKRKDILGYISPTLAPEA